MSPRVVTAPFTRRTGRQLVFCLAGLPFVVLSPPVLFVLVATVIGRGAPTAADLAIAGAGVGLLLVLLVTTTAARRLGALQRGLAGRLLGVRVDAPPGRPGLRDRAGWRVIGYQLVKLPIGLIQLYAVYFWVGGLVNLSYPLLWGAFRNHPPGTRLDPVPVFTPFGLLGDGTFQVTTLLGTFAAAAVGALMLLSTPGFTWAASSVDAGLMQSLLGPGQLAQRVHDLERSRALAVDISAALLRRLERDLHDGAQIRLATVAMHLGMAR
jgi:hypothetical protein